MRQLAALALLLHSGSCFVHFHHGVSHKNHHAASKQTRTRSFAPWRQGVTTLKASRIGETEVAFRNITFAVTVVQGENRAWPPLLLVPPVGLGIDKSFYDPFCSTWASTGVPGAVHAPDLLGTGSCSPLPTRRDPPLTPAAWAAQLLAYIRENCEGGSAIVMAQGGSCPIALEMAAVGGDSVLGLVLCGPPNLKRLNEAASPAAAARAFGLLESPLGLAFYRFARTKAFLKTFSQGVLFADDKQVDAAWIDGCHARGKNLQLRHAVFSVLSGAAGGRDSEYLRRLSAFSGPALLLGGKDVAKEEKARRRRGKKKRKGNLNLKGSAAAGESSSKRSSEAEESGEIGGEDGGGNGVSVKEPPLERMLAYSALMQDAEPALASGWNVLPFESAEEVAQKVASFVERRFAPTQPPRFGAPAVPRVPLIAGNWKLNPATISEATALADAAVAGATVAAAAATAAAAAASRDVGSSSATVMPLSPPPEVVLFVPAPFLVPVARRLALAAAAVAPAAGGQQAAAAAGAEAGAAVAAAAAAVAVGAQDAYTETKGAFTGEVSNGMVKAAGAGWVLVGHSERRTLPMWADKDEVVGAKLRGALAAGLKPVLCVGESRDEYEEGLVQQICEMQLAKALAGVTGEEISSEVSIAYEPVWAIGTCLTATPVIAQSVHSFIRRWLARRYGAEVAERVRILYGGSVTPETVDELMACPDIDGCLVGGASLDAAKFGRIIAFEAPGAAAASAAAAAAIAAATSKGIAA